MASRRLLGAVVIGGALASSAGCVDNTVSIFIRQVQAPTASGTTCTLSSDPTGLTVPVGRFDVAVANHYTIAPLIANQMISRANADQLRVETTFFSVEGFVVELHQDSPDGPRVGPGFTVYQNTIVPPGASAGTPGYAYTQLEVIPTQIGLQLKNTVCALDMRGVTSDCPVPAIQSNDRSIVAKLTAFGNSLGQHSIESAPFYYPIHVCCGCLLRFPTDADAPDMTHPGPDCLLGTATIDAAGCNPGQDFGLDCRLCSNSNPLCQPRGFSVSGTGTCPR